MRGVFMKRGKKKKKEKKKNPSIVTSQLFRQGDNSSSFYANQDVSRFSELKDTISANVKI